MKLESMQPLLGALPLVACLVLGSCPASGDEVFLLSQTDACAFQEITGVGRWCPPSPGLEEDPVYEVLFEPITGDPAPTIAVTSWELYPDSNPEGIRFAARMGPHPGTGILRLRATFSTAVKEYSAPITVRGDVEGCTSCVSDELDVGDESISIEEGLRIAFVLGRNAWSEYEHRHAATPLALVLETDAPGPALAKPGSLVVTGYSRLAIGAEGWDPNLLCDKRCDPPSDPDLCPPGTLHPRCTLDNDSVRCGTLRLRVSQDEERYALIRELTDHSYRIDVYDDVTPNDAADPNCCCLNMNSGWSQLYAWYVESPLSNPNSLIVRRLGGADQIEAEHLLTYDVYAHAWSSRKSVPGASGDALETTAVWSEDPQAPAAERWKRRITRTRLGTPNYDESVVDTFHPELPSGEPSTLWSRRLEYITPGQYVAGQSAALETRRGYITGPDPLVQDALAWESRWDGGWVWNTYTNSTESGGTTILRSYTPWGDEGFDPGAFTVSSHFSERKIQRRYPDAFVSGTFVSEDKEVLGSTLLRLTTEEMEPNVSGGGSVNYGIRRDYADAVEFLETRIGHKAPPASGPPVLSSTLLPIVSIQDPSMDGNTLPTVMLYNAYTFQNELRGQCSQVADDNQQYWIQSTFSYRPDLHHRLITDSAGRTIASGVSLQSPQAAWRDWSLNSYDVRGRLVRQTYSNCTARTIEWDDCCGSRVETDVDGVVTTYRHDASGRPLAITRAAYGSSQKARVTRYTYGPSAEGYPTAMIAVGYLANPTDPPESMTIVTRTVIRDI